MRVKHKTILTRSRRPPTTNTTPQILMDVKRVKKDYDRSFYSGVGLGLHYRVLGMDKGFNPLRVEDVARAYRQVSACMQPGSPPSSPQP